MASSYLGWNRCLNIRQVPFVDSICASNFLIKWLPVGALSGKGNAFIDLLMGTSCRMPAFINVVLAVYQVPGSRSEWICLWRVFRPCPGQRQVPAWSVRSLLTGLTSPSTVPLFWYLFHSAQTAVSMPPPSSPFLPLGAPGGLRCAPLWVSNMMPGAQQELSKNGPNEDWLWPRTKVPSRAPVQVQGPKQEYSPKVFKQVWSWIVFSMH